MSDRGTVEPGTAQSGLLEKVQAIQSSAGFLAVALAYHDYETGEHFSHNGDRSFHAASTFKAAVLLAIYKAAEEGYVKLDDELHVRNRFVSIIDGSSYRVFSKHDGEASVHRRIGRCMPVADLARAMIVRSSNLATNLLIDYLGIDRVQAILREAQLDGIKVVRGVEDEIAFEREINNEVTADGLLKLFQLLYAGDFLSESSRKAVIEILLAQEFNDMIPAHLPEDVDVAHKTGEISTVCHDAGVLFVPERKPYVLVILTEAPGQVEGRSRAVAKLSAAVYHLLCPAQKSAHG